MSGILHPDLKRLIWTLICCIVVIFEVIVFFLIFRINFGLIRKNPIRLGLIRIRFEHFGSDFGSTFRRSEVRINELRIGSDRINPNVHPYNLVMFIHIKDEITSKFIEHFFVDHIHCHVICITLFIAN